MTGPVSFTGPWPMLDHCYSYQNYYFAAVPAAGYVFVEWEGPVVNPYVNPATLYMDGRPAEILNLKAIFEPKECGSCNSCCPECEPEIIEKIVYVDKIVEVTVEVEKIVTVEVEKIVEVPVEKIVEIEVIKEGPVDCPDDDSCFINSIIKE